MSFDGKGMLSIVMECFPSCCVGTMHHPVVCSMWASAVHERTVSMSGSSGPGQPSLHGVVGYFLELILGFVVASKCQSIMQHGGHSRLLCCTWLQEGDLINTYCVLLIPQKPAPVEPAILW